MTAEFHEGLPFDAYLDLEAESATALKDMLVSPRLYAWRKEYGRPDKDALRVGRATHTAILEPHRFQSDYAVWESRRAGKDWDAFCEQHADKTIITRAQRDVALQVSAAVKTHPVARALLADPSGRAEVSITWTHPRTGLACKSRIDWLCSMLVDLKTCRDPSPHMFSGAAARLGHHVQMAFYSAALAAHGLNLPVKLIAAQNVEPYDVVVYDVPEKVILLGEQLYESALDRITACRLAQSWPGMAPDAEMPLKLPAWANPDYDGTDDEWSVSVGEGGV